jgi:hypothetical protein
MELVTTFNLWCNKCGQSDKTRKVPSMPRTQYGCTRCKVLTTTLAGHFQTVKLTYRQPDKYHDPSTPRPKLQSTIKFSS